MPKFYNDISKYALKLSLSIPSIGKKKISPFTRESKSRSKRRGAQICSHCKMSLMTKQTMFKRQKIKIKYPDSILCDFVFYNLTVNNCYVIAICSTMNTYMARCCLTSNFSVLLQHVSAGSYLGCCTSMMLGRWCGLKGCQWAAVQGESSWGSPPLGGDKTRWLTGTYGRAGGAQCCAPTQAKLIVAIQKSRCPYPSGQIWTASQGWLSAI